MTIFSFFSQPAHKFTKFQECFGLYHLQWCFCFLSSDAVSAVQQGLGNNFLGKSLARMLKAILVVRKVETNFDWYGKRGATLRIRPLAAKKKYFHIDSRINHRVY